MTTDLQSRLVQVARAFRPGAPVDIIDLFAGRTQQMNDLIHAVAEPFTHAIVFGERGVGKTSLVTVVGGAMPEIFRHGGVSLRVIRENCAESDTFVSIWRRALRKCPFGSVESRGLGFGAPVETNVATGDMLIGQNFGPGEVSNVLARAPEHVAFIFDEFDRVEDKSVASPMADLLKMLSDHHVKATIVIVGVGDNVTELISAHNSIERCTRQIHMPRMSAPELNEILDKGERICGIRFHDQARKLVVYAAKGFPHYVHLLASEAARAAAVKHAEEITVEHLGLSLGAAIDRSQRSLTDAHMKAIQSPRKDALYRDILLACAIVGNDEQGYFRPADLVEHVGRVLRRSGVSTNMFMGHLMEFSAEKRGNILKRIGEPRNYRFRFSNPLMAPYVIVHGLRNGLVRLEDLVPNHDPGPNVSQ